MGFIMSVALVLVVLGAAGIIKIGTELGAVLILVAVVAFVLFGISESGKDYKAYVNRRDYWLKRGSGVHDKRMYDERRRRR